MKFEVLTVVQGQIAAAGLWHCVVLLPEFRRNLLPHIFSI